MAAICIARFALERDLSLLSRAFHQEGIGHRFTEEQGEQRLWLANSHQQAQAQALVEAFLSGQSLVVEPSVQTPQSFSAVAWLMRSPVTWLFIVVGALGYAAVAAPMTWLYELLTYTPTKIVGAKVLVAKWQWAEPWRMLTPVFLHFSLAHIIFNAAAMVQVGSWVERLWGLRFYLVLCVLTGIAGNALQYSWSQSPMFGGLSGIVFGLFTFNGVTQLLQPHKAFPLPKGLYVMLAVWLIAGFTPFFEQVFGVQMGNGAHLGGAIAGAVIAVLASWTQAKKRFSQP
ncbi:MAG TPA: rhomboid family intramembrane serine protease [Marinagarivorans sp.]